jgi:nucleotide-binding universal stress UspA family protein
MEQTTLSRVLVPVDFSSCSRAALEYASFLASRLSATVDVLHVWEPPHYVRPDVLLHPHGEAQQTLQQFARSNAGREMEWFLGNVESHGVKVKGRLEFGNPYHVILEISSSGAYDLIVMGTHGRTGLSHLLLGSIAEKIVRRASCPVITIRSSEQEPAEKGAAA